MPLVLDECRAVPLTRVARGVYEGSVSAPSPPQVVILAGPNGAGKSTAAPRLLRGRLRVHEFVNADTIARGLSAFAPEQVAIDAGRILLRRLDQLAREGHDFAFETTLASRTLATRLERWRATGYHLHLVFLSLPSTDLAVARVRERVLLGGHDVPEDTIRRRYTRGVTNFLDVYRSLVTTWRLYENTGVRPRLIARGDAVRRLVILDPVAWARFTEGSDG